MQQPHNSIIVIIGATGDLATKNLIPALYELFSEKPDLNFSLIGVANQSLNEPELLQRVRPFLTQFDQKKWTLFMQRTDFIEADITDDSTYAMLAERIKKIEHNNVYNRIVYCACPPELFIAIAKSCVSHKIMTRQDSQSDSIGSQKIVFEKPFGTSMQTAQDLNDAVTKILSEDQIVRADHYLAKELVETIAYLRFTNEIFEPIWNTNHIKCVIITLKETVNVAHRAGLYDTLGVIRDVIQSHALQLLSLVAMEPPVSLQPRDLHTEKIAVLKTTTITHAIVGQYRGYRQHAGVRPQSTTPTYALVTCAVETPRWQKVPFIIQAGKALDTQTTEIKIIFKQPLCKITTGCPLSHNELRISIAPQGEFELVINIKKPDNDKNTSIMPIKLNFCYSCMWPYTPQAYRIIFEALMKNIQSISVPFTEINQAWKIVDATLKEGFTDIAFYEIGSAGPVQAVEYLDHLTDKKSL